MRTEPLSITAYEYFDLYMRQNWEIPPVVDSCWVEPFAHEVGHIYAGARPEMRVVKATFENRSAPLANLEQEVSESIRAMSPHDSHINELVTLAAECLVLPKWLPDFDQHELVKHAYNQGNLGTFAQSWTLEETKRRVFSMKRTTEAKRVAKIIDAELAKEYESFRTAIKEL